MDVWFMTLKFKKKSPKSIMFFKNNKFEKPLARMPGNSYSLVQT